MNSIFFSNNYADWGNGRIFKNALNTANIEIIMRIFYTTQRRIKQFYVPPCCRMYSVYLNIYLSLSTSLPHEGYGFCLFQALSLNSARHCSHLHVIFYIPWEYALWKQIIASKISTSHQSHRHGDWWEFVPDTIKIYFIGECSEAKLGRVHSIRIHTWCWLAMSKQIALCILLFI